MTDELVSALLPERGLRVVVARCTALARRGQQLHQAHPVSAALFAQALTGAALLASLQKARTRINLQVECDGPLRGIFCDAAADGMVRGYVKNPRLDVELATGPFHWRAALGNKGFLSVLRDLGGGEFYRSSVELVAFDLAADLERYFQSSEQVDSAVLLAAEESGAERLGGVAGLLVQRLPDGDASALKALGEELKAGAFQELVRQGPRSAAQLLTSAVRGAGEAEWMSRYPLEFRCGCSRERVHRALLALGRSELEDLLAKEGQAEVTCEFCTTRYLVPGPELKSLLPPVDAGN